MITHERLRILLRYDPDTGVWIWIAKSCSKSRIAIGSVAGSVNHHGYIKLKIDGIVYLSHRLAVFYMTGRWPKDEVDHRDLDKANNRWENLREATGRQNMANQKAKPGNTSGFKGVSWDKSAHKWRAQISFMNKKTNLGFFDQAEAAHLAYINAACQLNGEFARSA